MKYLIEILKEKKFTNQREKELENAFLLGRFDKNKFNLLVSVVVGRNGGMYAFLNSLPDSNLDRNLYE